MIDLYTAATPYGFKASIAKPYTLEELDSTLHSIIATGKWQVH